jgi:DNA-directed RNA polymerase specialized sigma24 family protein
MSVKDIAQLLGEKETTISMRLKRAIEKLKEMYNVSPS